MILSQELQDAIAKQLPGMFATEMQGFLAQAKKDADEVVSLNARVATLKKTETELHDALRQHSEMGVREQALKARETKLQDSELELLKREAKLEAQIAIAELTGVKYGMEQFLRNVTVRSVVQSSVMKPVEGMPAANGSYGSPGTLMNATDMHTTLESKE